MKDFSYTPPIEKPAIENLHYADHVFQSASSLCSPPVRLQDPTADQELQRETIALQRRHTDLQHHSRSQSLRFFWSRGERNGGH